MSSYTIFHRGADVRGGKCPAPPPDTPATCLVSHVASAGLEPTNTAVRWIKSAEIQRPYPLGHGGRRSFCRDNIFEGSVDLNLYLKFAKRHLHGEKIPSNMHGTFFFVQ